MGQEFNFFISLHFSQMHIWPHKQNKTLGILSKHIVHKSFLKVFPSLMDIIPLLLFSLLIRLRTLSRLIFGLNANLFKSITSGLLINLSKSILISDIIIANVNESSNDV